MGVAAVLGLGAFAAYSQVQAGKQQAKAIERQAEYNAQVYEQQAQMIQEKKKLEEYQYNREAARMRGSVIAKTGKAGFLPTGSPLAVLADNETQLELDKAMGQYNLEIERRYATSGAAWSRYAGASQARLAKTTGYTNAFSTMLGTFAQVSSMGGGMRTPSQGRGV